MMIHEFITLHPIFTYLFLGLFSLAIGSLLNVIIYRLPLMLQAEWTSECRILLHQEEVKTEKINLFLPRSFCPNCKTLIPFWHNIPIVSYCLLRGHCRKCHQHIPLSYLMVEIFCPLLSLFSAYFFGFHLSLLFVLLFIWINICLFFIDLKEKILPDGLTLSLLWIGLLANTEHIFTTLPDAVFSTVIAYLFLWVFIQLFYLATGKIGMGHGDFKLFAAFGAWFGWTFLPLILLISSITGAIVGLMYLRVQKKTRETPIPYGPFLCLAGLISLFYGHAIIEWYLGFYMSR